MNIVDDCVGEELGAQSYNWRRFLDQGIHLSGGSDSPVESFAVLPNIQYAVTRTNFQSGKSWNPENAVTMEEAVRMFTYEGAYAAFAEQIRGTLTVGKEADMVVLDQDIFRTADLAEEVARFYGYDNIPMTLPSGEATTGKKSFKMRVEETAREVAEFCGFSQGMCYSFESPKVFDKLRLPADSPLRRAVTILNPLGEDFSIMRTISLNGMLTSLATNYNRRNKNVRLYELGNIYLPKQLPLTELPKERMMFTLGMYGEGDFFTMKGVVEEFLEKVGMHKKVQYDPSDKKPFLHPGRQADVIYEGTCLGYLGEIHPEVADQYDLKTRVYVAVVDILSVLEYATYDRKYTGIAKYPAVTRDISMVVPKTVMVGEIEKIIEQRGGKILESYQLFDVYEGDQIEEGYKSVAYSITFRAADRTLAEADITAAMKKILNGLEGLGAVLRQ